MGKSKAKKPSRDQKIKLDKCGLVAENWLILKETADTIKCVSRASGRTRIIYK